MSAGLGEATLTPEDADDSDKIDGLIARIGVSPLARARFARTFLLPKGYALRARELSDDALAKAPDDGEIRIMGAEINSAGVSDMYFSVVRDEVRNAAFDRAISRAVGSGARVLDIGTGTGLFAMMAARAGAAEVVSCEPNEAVAEAARRVVARNGYADRIIILAKKSTELVLGQDLKERADVLVWDNTGSDLVSLGTLPALEDAARRLVKPEGRIIPAGASIHASLAEYARLPNWRMAITAGFDLAPFNAFAQPGIPLTRGALNLEIRSDAARLFEFAFGSGAYFAPERVSCDVTATGGRANGLVQWVEFTIDENETYSARPEVAHSAFFPVFWPSLGPFEAGPGRLFSIGASHDRQNLRLWLDGPR